MTAMNQSIQVQELLDAIKVNIEPKLHVDKSHGGYDCCGCSTYGVIVDDIKDLIRELAEEPEE